MVWRGRGVMSLVERGGITDSGEQLVLVAYEEGPVVRENGNV